MSVLAQFLLIMGGFAAGLLGGMLFAWGLGRILMDTRYRVEDLEGRVLRETRIRAQEASKEKHRSNQALEKFAEDRLSGNDRPKNLSDTSVGDWVKQKMGGA